MHAGEEELLQNNISNGAELGVLTRDQTRETYDEENTVTILNNKPNDGIMIHKSIPENCEKETVVVINGTLNPLQSQSKESDPVSFQVENIF